MADASSVLGVPQVAGAWVNRRGKAKRTMGTVAGVQVGGALGSTVAATIVGKDATQPTPETPDFGAFGYLALSDTELVLIRGKQGLLGLKMTDEVAGRAPRSDVASIALGDGKVAAPLTITFTAGREWELEVARASRRAAEQVVAELGG